MGETLYLASAPLMQRCINQLKKGFDSALEITSGLVKKELAEDQIQRYKKMIVCDTIQIPHHMVMER
jgi:hypothetical protein|tara:strand:- start:2677 stop:2877 length:201 start_codon:yes stop_codon:yes gene_type:complete